MAKEEVALALSSYDRSLDNAYLVTGESEREEMQARFPQSGWPSMPLTRYAIGQDDSSETYCRWAEFKTPHLGSIKGGNAGKLLIYKRRTGEGWHYDEAAFDSVEAAWEAVRSQFVRAMEATAAGDWELIDALEALKPGQALLVKTLHVYFPDRILPIASRAHLRHYLALLDRPEADDTALSAVALNRLLLGALREIDAVERPTNELERFLYRHFAPPTTARWVKISPGPLASRWEECRDGGFIAVGWDELGDLREFPSKDEFKAAFAEALSANYNNQAHVISKKANELWTLMDLRAGDRVVANRGKSKILAVGRVVEPGYEHDPQRDTYRHLVRVEWDEGYAKEIPQQGAWLNTLDKVTAAQRKLIEGDGAPAGPEGAEVEVDPLYPRLAEALEAKRQVVLYGPPGTGKTYHARRFAAWWLRRAAGGSAPGAVLADAQAVADAERELAAAGQWRFTTFHPSYAYEDFVEGYRPAADGSGELSLALEDGIFKRLCADAAADPDRPYLLIVDEINRANVAKVFGELITLLEADKRGLAVTLPQSKQRFAVPPNVHLLGTMNTADRSITLMDVALRRRFAFVELMPEPDRVEQAVGSLKLADFLAGLNRAVARVAGREKQVGHAYLMPGGTPLADPGEFARVFRLEILPLLQEYCYEEYDQLNEILGPAIVDVEAQAFKEVLDEPDDLVEALAQRFSASAAGATGGP